MLRGDFCEAEFDAYYFNDNSDWFSEDDWLLNVKKYCFWINSREIDCIFESLSTQLNHWIRQDDVNRSDICYYIILTILWRFTSRSYISVYIIILIFSLQRSSIKISRISISRSSKNTRITSNWHLRNSFENQFLNYFIISIPILMLLIYKSIIRIDSRRLSGIRMLKFNIWYCLINIMKNLILKH